MLSSLKTLYPFFSVLEFTEIYEVDKMKKTGINNFSTFARRACCNKEIFTLDFSEYKNIISEISSTKSELKRIGNNINQIAKSLNENKNNQTESLMSDYQNQLENLENKIQKVVQYISEG
ncbi:plasmid mobilization relaxosome protein MobC [Lactococcus lactis]|nr:plasmid mobilization relaxosome protein MobC [Lactococcus lactis]